jgi:hypothetical protein
MELGIQFSFVKTSEFRGGLNPPRYATDVHLYTPVRYSGEFLRFMWLGVPSALSGFFLIYFMLLYVANTSVSSEVQNAVGGRSA